VTEVFRPGAVRLETEDGKEVFNSWNIEHLKKYHLQSFYIQDESTIHCSFDAPGTSEPIADEARPSFKSYFVFAMHVLVATTVNT
jgi:hypothetical protein